MSEYMKMVQDSVKSGANENVMWHAVEVADDLLTDIKEKDPARYDQFMRKMSEVLFGHHYGEELARKEVSRMFHKDKDGNIIRGAHWEPDQVKDAWDFREFSDKVNKYDMFVAANAFWHDFSTSFDDDQVLEAAYLFFFADDDFDGDDKVWKYMGTMCN